MRQTPKEIVREALICAYQLLLAVKDQQQTTWLDEMAYAAGMCAKNWEKLPVDDLWKLVNLIKILLPNSNFDQSNGPIHLEAIQDHQNDEIAELAGQMLEIHYGAQYEDEQIL